MSGMRDAPDTSIANLSLIEPEPLDAVYRLECTLKARWALKIIGKDETGNARVLALDWDGVWHPLDPVTGLPARIGTVVRFRDLRVGEVAFSERAGDHWPYAARVGVDAFTWTRQGGEFRPAALDIWDGEDDLVRIFAVDANQTTLRQVIDEHAVKAGAR